MPRLPSYILKQRFIGPGVNIDEKLMWYKNIAAVDKFKMARYMGIMYRIKRFLPLKVRLQSKVVKYVKFS